MLKYAEPNSCNGWIRTVVNTLSVRWKYPDSSSLSAYLIKERKGNKEKENISLITWYSKYILFFFFFFLCVYFSGFLLCTCRTQVCYLMFNISARYNDVLCTFTCVCAEWTVGSVNLGLCLGKCMLLRRIHTFAARVSAFCHSYRQNKWKRLILFFF